MDLVRRIEAINICSESTLHPNLPPEIITEILFRLPVHSLLKFKCVCKSWLISISSSQFIKSYLDITTKSTSYSKYTLILASRRSLNGPTTLYTCPLSSIFSNAVLDNLRPFHFPMSVSVDYLSFVGSCNDLLCISIDCEKIVLLYNPSIRKLKMLPVSGTDTGTTSFTSYGFCYDEISDDFKVVKLTTASKQASTYGTEVKVYSLKNDSWRNIENNHDGFIYGRRGQSVGGILHWRTHSKDFADLIFAVNTVTNMCDTLEPPKDDGKDGIEEGWLSLGELNGCLVAFCDYYKTRLDVWAMKEYGVKESWSKVASIAYPANPSGHIWPLFVLENAEVCLRYRPYMMLYNSRNNLLTFHQLDSKAGPCSVAAPPYIESLVDPSFIGE